MAQAEAVKQKTVMMPINRQNSKRVSTLEEEIAELEAQNKPQQEADNEPDTEVTEEEETAETTEASQEEEPDTEEDNEEKPLTKEEETFKKRYGDLRRHSQKKEQELAKRIEELESKLESGSEAKPPVSEEELEEWMKKYPDAANMVEAVAQKIADKQIKSVAKDFDSVREEQHQLRREKAISKIEKAHPDFQDLQADDAFHDWADRKPKWVKNALYENEEDAESVIEVINLYKYDTGAPARSKTKEKEAASSVKTKGKGKPAEDSGKYLFRESDVARKDFDYEKHAEAIEKAIREGKFDFDISGAAR